MIEIVRSRLDARERHRWARALAQKPILAARVRRARGPFVVALSSGVLTTAMIGLVIIETLWRRGDAAMGALAAGGITFLALLAEWAWRQARSRWPAGRFLFPWGYVEVEHDRLRYVDARLLETDVEGAHVVVRSGDWSASFAAPIDPDLGAIGSARPMRDGYRDGPWVITGREVHPPRVSGRIRGVVWVVLVATLGAIAADAGQRHHAAVARPSTDRERPAPTAGMPSRSHRF